MTKSIDLSIIIPAFNEEDRIVPTLMNTLTYLRSRPYYSQIIVVSDGSTDNTGRVADRFGTEENVRIDVLEYHPNRGKGYAVQYGMRQGLGKICMFMTSILNYICI